MLHNNRWEESTQNTPNQQRKGTDSRANISGGKLDCFTKSDTPKDMIMRNSQDPMKCKTRAQSGQISHTPKRLGIDT